MLELVEAAATEELKNDKVGPGRALLPEFERLSKQECPYCSGWGHSGNDCPTDRKISHMRGGVREQNAYIQKCRKAARIASGMANVSGFSLLSAKPSLVGQKRKFSSLVSEVQSMDGSILGKRARYN